MTEKKAVDPELRAFVEDIVAGIFNAGYLFEKDEEKADAIIRRVIHEKIKAWKKEEE
jgi:hypothetical protein